MKQQAGAFRERLVAPFRTPQGRRALRWLRGLFFVGILAFLGYRLTEIGWGAVWEALPRQPAFYLILLAMYFILPLTESLIYGQLWRTRARDCLPVLVRKRVLNQEVLGYSGELYLYLWAKDRTALPRGRLLRTIKDNLIVSSVATIGSAVALLILLLATGVFKLSDLGHTSNPFYLLGGLVVLLLIGAGLLTLRRSVFMLPGRTLMSVLAAHLLRFALTWSLQIAQWWVVLPEVPLRSWAFLIGVMVAINRIPLVPSKDLVFVGVGVELAGVVGVPAAAIAGLLLARSALDKALNAGLFVLTSWWERRHPESVRPLALDDLTEWEEDLPDSPPAAAVEENIHP